MKIVETGAPPVFLRPGVRLTCSGCKCLFELEMGDSVMGRANPILYGANWPVHCPRCESFVAMGTTAKPHKT